MDRNTFKAAVNDCVGAYITDYSTLRGNTQLAVNPDNLSVSLIQGQNIEDAIDDANEAIENAVIAHGLALQDDTDYQASRNPDYYSLATLVSYAPDGTMSVNEKEVDRLADTYFIK